MTSFFAAEGGPIWIKFCRLVQNDLLIAVIWSKSKPDVEFQYGGRLGEFHVIQEPPAHCRVLPLGEFTVMIPEPHATLQGAVTWRNQCHDRDTLHGVIIPSAILKIGFRHIFFCFFKCSVGFDERRLSYCFRYERSCSRSRRERLNVLHAKGTLAQSCSIMAQVTAKLAKRSMAN